MKREVDNSVYILTKREDEDGLYKKDGLFKRPRMKTAYSLYDLVDKKRESGDELYKKAKNEDSLYKKDGLYKEVEKADGLNKD
ncbi:hypothetical protein IMSHALPRED_008137 [Imshaugia aleurites]|uniref:Uncharacterized protein n=1 Tax=Imshaugia aleurites TaxID=172621 RepID=A0A8H3FW17_9LECA|nr:hypothetical protein IMSHALPRED_008137 [Imshaugia aleurites]